MSNSAIQPSAVEDSIEAIASDDQIAQEAIGKKPAFDRRFNVWTAMGITICISGTWEGISAVLVQALTLGGPVSLLYGYLLCAVTMICVAASLAELSSIWPSSGAQYHWTAELAPPRARIFMSWFAGWIVIGYLWTASVACAIGVASQVQSYVIVGNATYGDHAERWHVYVMYLFICLLALIVNLWGMKWVHNLNIVAMVIHILGYLATIIIFPAMTENKNDAKFVFTTFINNSGWKYDGVAFCVGIMTSMFGFGGIETAAHFAEEIKHVTTSLPRAIFWTVCVNAIMVFPWIITLLYCLGDINKLLASPIALTSPITVVYLNTTGSPAAAIILSCMGSYLAFIGTADSLAAASRAVWAMARDNAIPEPFRRLHPTLNVPVWCIIVCWVPECLIGMIYIWNRTAFYGVTSGVLSLYTISFMIPIGTHLLYARRNVQITYGPWNLGRWGYPINTVAFCWSVFILIFLCFPSYQPLTSANMNYAVAIIGSFTFLSIITYVIYGRKHFIGPVVEITDGYVESDNHLKQTMTAENVSESGDSNVKRE